MISCQTINPKADKTILVIDINKLKKALRSYVERGDGHLQVSIPTWNDEFDDVPKDRVIDAVNQSIPDRNTILKEISATLHENHLFEDFMSESEAIEIVIDRIAEKVRCSIDVLNNKIKENRKWCIEDRVEGGYRIVCTWDRSLGCEMPSYLDRCDETLHRTYAATREECVEKALAADDYEFFPCKEAVRRSLVEYGWTTVECDGRTRILRFVDP